MDAFHLEFYSQVNCYGHVEPVGMDGVTEAITISPCFLQKAVE